jgi:hypothetical protein
MGQWEASRTQVENKGDRTKCGGAAGQLLDCVHVNSGVRGLDNTGLNGWTGVACGTAPSRRASNAVRPTLPQSCIVDLVGGLGGQHT